MVWKNCLGDRFSDYRAYLFAFARNGGRLAHHLLLVCCLRVDRKVLCSRRSIGVDPSDSPARGCALAASASCCGRCPVHRYRYACVPAMLQVEYSPVDLLLYSHIVAQISEPQEEGVRVRIAGTGGPVYRSRQLPRFIVTAVSQHFCETVHVLLVGSATASADF